jgi:hypothetical protein
MRHRGPAPLGEIGKIQPVCWAIANLLGILTPFFISLSATIEYGMADKR